MINVKLYELLTFCCRSIAFPLILIYLGYKFTPNQIIRKVKEILYRFLVGVNSIMFGTNQDVTKVHKTTGILEKLKQYFFKGGNAVIKDNESGSDAAGEKHANNLVVMDSLEGLTIDQVR